MYASTYIRICMYVRMHVCMYVCMYICTYVYMYVCTYVRTYVRMYVFMYVCTYVRTYVCTYVCMYACMYVCMYSLCFVDTAKPRTMTSEPAIPASSTHKGKVIGGIFILCLLTIVTCVLTCCGDIETNPGPECEHEAVIW